MSPVLLSKVTVLVRGNILPRVKISLVTACPVSANLYVMLTGRALNSSTIKEETEKRGESIADCRAAPFAIVSRAFRVRKVSVLLKTCLQMSMMIGVLVQSPISSTEWI